MKARFSVGKLFVARCLLVVGLLIGIFGFRFNISASELLIRFVSLTVAGLAFTYLLLYKWSQPLEQLTNFVAALPDEELNLPNGELLEMQDLARAMLAMAERVRHVVEHASLESSRRETILACMAEGVLAVDKGLKVVFCNGAFAQAFNARMPVQEGRPLYEVVREPMLREILERVLESGTAETDRFQLPSAAGRWFEARALPLGGATTSGAVVVLHDITEIQREEQLRKDFVADVSHELRTPLAAIRGYAETLLDGALDDPQNNRKFLEIILSHAVRLNNIALDLLVLSELDSNLEPSVPIERISLPEVIDSALHTVENAAHARGVRLDRSQCNECAVLGYRFRLEQVMINLLDNAVKFNRPDGEVAIECGQADGRVHISIADTGIGIPSEELNRIFERFYRVDKARSRATGGTGLGLPIVKQVIDRMGGAVSVESQLGRGSRFTIMLEAAP